MKKIFFLLTVFAISACAPKLPEQTNIYNNYSIQNIRTFSVNIDCEKPKLSDIQANFVESYCPILEGNIKIALQNENPAWRHDNENPEIIIETILEQVHGGSAATRFWVGFGAGRSVTTVYIKIFKNNEIIAERRFNETTTMPDLISGSWSNEEAIIQDAHLIAEKIAEFVRNPTDYESRQSSP